MVGTNITTPPKSRYLLAKASNRAGARIIDVMFVLLLSLGFGALIIATDAKGFKDALNLQESWRYFLITAIAFAIFFGYFILLPFFWEGQTLGKKVFKLRVYCVIPTKNSFLCYVKREFFLWIITATGNLVLGIILWSLNGNAYKLLNDLLKPGSVGFPEYQYISTIFDVVYAISFVLLLFCIIHMCINNRKRAFHDRISDTCVIKLVDVNSKEAQDAMNVKPDKAKRNYGLPGEISPTAVDEIDSF